MKPLTREEQYLNRLTGEYEQALPEEPITRKEQYLSRLCGSDNIIPQEPLTREEQFLANLCGEEIETPEPLTRLEQYMAFAGGESETKPASPLTRQEKYWDEYQGGAVPEEKTLTGNPISVTDALAQDALSLQVAFTPTQDGTPSIDSEPTTEPYLSKVIPRGNKEYYSLVGGTVAWNQIAPETSSGWSTASVIVSVTDNEYTVTPVSDSNSLKGMHFSASGKKNHVMFCSSLFKISNSDYEVFIGVKQTPSNVMRFDKRTRSTSYELCECIGKVVDDTDMFTIRVGNNTPSMVTANAKNIMFCDLTLMFANAPAIADYAYSLEQSEAGSGIAWLKSYGFFTEDYYPYNPGELISVNTSGHKIGSTTYPIDNIDLRGLFKLNNGKLYCEGDIYPPSGGVERKFEYRAYQSGDESLTDAITDGTHTVVKLTTPTTESATPYTSPVDVEAGGTEEFVDNRTVQIPVGNDTYYASEFEVYGKTGVTVSHGATSSDTPTEYEVEFTQQGTVYGGMVDIVSGVLTVTWGYIASYNGETLTGRWMSSKDVYAEGTTPSTGAEVAYELATPQTYQLTAQQVQMLLGDNYLETEDETITLTYMAKAAERVRAMNAKLTQNKQTLALKKANSLSKGDLK